MHWPSDNEWWQILVLFGILGVVDLLRDCKKLLKNIAVALENQNPVPPKSN